MAAEVFRTQLNAASFPLISRNAHQTVMVPGLDQNLRTPQSFYGDPASADYAMPQLLYGENIMPAAEGVMATAFQQIIAPPVAGDFYFDQFIQLRDEEENLVFFAPAKGRNFIYKTATAGWIQTNPIATTNAAVSRAYVNGRTFVCYAGLGIYEYNSVANTFTAQPLVGIAAADVMGITQSSNYLIAHTRIGVHWSSLINPLDFTPSLQTGAGNLIPQDVKGPITACVGVPGGFLVFTTRNCVAATYSTNVNQPFVFREVDQCGGVEDSEQITTESSSAKVYAWTTGGLQAVSLRSAEALYPEVSDFLAGKIWEEWDYGHKKFDITRQVTDLRIKMTHVSSRYLVISYGRRNEMFAYALVFDTALKRWGKVKINHTDVTFFTYLPAGVARTYATAGAANETYASYNNIPYADTSARSVIEASLKDSLAFLQANGSVVQLVMDYRERTAAAVAVFGRYQLRRSEFVTLQTVQFDHIDPDWELKVTALMSLDGAEQWKAVPGVEIERSGYARTYGFGNPTGRNFCIAAEGTFELKDLTMTVTRGGK